MRYYIRIICFPALSRQDGYRHRIGIVPNIGILKIRRLYDSCNSQCLETPIRHACGHRVQEKAVWKVFSCNGGIAHPVCARPCFIQPAVLAYVEHGGRPEAPETIEVYISAGCDIRRGGRINIAEIESRIV